MYKFIEYNIVNYIDHINSYKINYNRKDLIINSFKNVFDSSNEIIDNDVDNNITDNESTFQNLNLKKCFPFDTIRDTQQIIFDKLKQCDKYKFILIEAMPGVGKSAIAITLANHFKTAYIITATKQLQDQYINEFDYITSIKGKANYKCHLEKNVTCDLAKCFQNKQLKAQCIVDQTCDYYKARLKAMLSPITVTSYSCFFTWFSNHLFKPRNLLILDESHLLDTQLTNWMTIKLNLKELDEKYNLQSVIDNKLFKKLNRMTFKNDIYDKKVELFITTIYNALKTQKEQLSKDLQNIDKDNSLIDTCSWNLGTAKTYKTKIKKLKELSNQIDNLIIQIDIFIQSSDKNLWLISHNHIKQDKIVKKELLIQPLYVGTLFKTYVEKFGIKHVIFLSATILSPKTFCEDLQIQKNEVGIIKVDSSFDPKKSPIIHLPVGKMNYESLSSTMPKIINTINLILNNYPNERGIIHTGNYKIAQEIIEKINNNRLIMKSAFENNETLLRKHSLTNNSVLVSPSLGTGTDLKDDLSRFQIIVKMPFMSLLDKRVKKKAELNNDWYNCEMLKLLIQSSGRSTRSENDYSDTYILDSSFPYWINTYNRWLPESFLKRIVWYKK